VGRPIWADGLGAYEVKPAPIRKPKEGRTEPPTVWTAYLTFPAWLGGDPASLSWKDNYGKSGNIVADGQGEMSFAEVELVKRLRESGWEAGWLDNFGHAPRRWRDWLVTVFDRPPDKDPVQSLPPHVRRRFLAFENAINRVRPKPSTRGRPDIVAWRTGQYSYIESKGPRDAINDDQELWAREIIAADFDIYGVVSWKHG
jgi:hypothetical protein